MNNKEALSIEPSQPDEFVPNDLEFQGQQEGERILYVIRPHGIKKVVNIFLAAFIAVFIFFILKFFGLRVPFDPLHYKVISIIIALLAFVGRLWWIELYCSYSKTVLTDRRIVRLEFSLPGFTKKRALFWNEVTKTKAYAPNLLFRFLKVGTLSLHPMLIPDEDITVNYVYYYDDIANYIDKILYLQKNKPEEITFLRPFVAKPKGKRY